MFANGEGFSSRRRNPLEALRHLFRNDPIEGRKFLPEVRTRNCYSSRKNSNTLSDPDWTREGKLGPGIWVSK